MEGGDVAVYCFGYGIISWCAGVIGEDRFYEGMLLPLMLSIFAIVALALVFSSAWYLQFDVPSPEVFARWVPVAILLNGVLVSLYDKLIFGRVMVRGFLS